MTAGHSPASDPASEGITVQGYSQRYADAVAELLDTEGGFVDDPVDRGGTTKYGISLRFLKAEGAFDADGDGIADFDLDFDGDIDGRDIRKLTRGDAIFLYLKCFWQPVGADQLPKPLGEAVFDQAVNGGLSAGKKLLQRAVNMCLMQAQRDGAGGVPATLTVDGSLGAQTRAAISWVLRRPGQGMPVLMEAYRDAVRERYQAIVRRYPLQRRFLRGWLARAERIGR